MLQQLNRQPGPGTKPFCQACSRAPGALPAVGRLLGALGLNDVQPNLLLQTEEAADLLGAGLGGLGGLFDSLQRQEASRQPPIVRMS